MRFTLLAGLAFVAGTVLVASLNSRVDASTGPIPLNCNRPCLENLVNQYLAAVVAHDPKKMPFSADVKYTENYRCFRWGTDSGRLRRAEESTRISPLIRRPARWLRWER